MHPSNQHAFKTWFDQLKNGRKIKDFIGFLKLLAESENTSPQFKAQLKFAIGYISKNKITAQTDFNLWFSEAFYPSAYKDQYIVAFLDILGFKELLIKGKTALIRRGVKTFADLIYSRRRITYLTGTNIFEPTVANFSDSIIIYSKLYDGVDFERINSIVFDEFCFLINSMVAYSLFLDLPLRGGVSIGNFYTEQVSSYTPTSVHRHGGPAIDAAILERFPEIVTGLENWESKILPAATIPIHFGNALTEAYLLESSINSIGVFMDIRHANGPYSEIIKYREIFGFLKTIELGQIKSIYFNWCKNIQAELYDVIQEKIKSNIESNTGRIAAKWKSLQRIERRLLR